LTVSAADLYLAILHLLARRAFALIECEYRQKQSSSGSNKHRSTLIEEIGGNEEEEEEGEEENEPREEKDSARSPVERFWKQLDSVVELLVELKEVTLCLLSFLFSLLISSLSSGTSRTGRCLCQDWMH